MNSTSYSFCTHKCTVDAEFEHEPDVSPVPEVGNVFGLEGDVGLGLEAFRYTRVPNSTWRSDTTFNVEREHAAIESFSHDDHESEAVRHTRPSSWT